MELDLQVLQTAYIRGSAHAYGTIGPEHENQPQLLTLQSSFHPGKLIGAQCACVLGCKQLRATAGFDQANGVGRRPVGMQAATQRKYSRALAPGSTCIHHPMIQLDRT